MQESHRDQSISFITSKARSENVASTWGHNQAPHSPTPVPKGRFSPARAPGCPHWLPQGGKNMPCPQANWAERKRTQRGWATQSQLLSPSRQSKAKSSFPLGGGWKEGWKFPPFPVFPEGQMFLFYGPQEGCLYKEENNPPCIVLAYTVRLHTPICRGKSLISQWARRRPKDHLVQWSSNFSVLLVELILQI